LRVNKILSSFPFDCFYRVFYRKHHKNVF
jgi:hypothetical protein